MKVHDSESVRAHDKAPELGPLLSGCSIFQSGYSLTFKGHSPACRRFKSAGLTSDKAQQYQSLGPCQAYSGWIYF